MAQQVPNELDIKTTFTPSGCNVKAQKGDSIKVHYVRVCTTRSLNPLNHSSPSQTGTLFSNGNKFDSRYVLDGSPFAYVDCKYHIIVTIVVNHCL